MKTSNTSERGMLPPRDLNNAELEAISGGILFSAGCGFDDPPMTNREWVEAQGVKWPIPAEK